MVLDSFFNLLFGWAINISPLFAVIFISFILTIFITLVYKWTTDQHLMKSLKEELKSFQKDMKKFKDDPSKVMELQKLAMEKNMKYMMHSFKPLLITFIPLIIIFGWLRSTFNGTGDILFGFGWLGTYIIFSIVFSFIVRKILKVH